MIVIKSPLKDKEIGQVKAMTQTEVDKKIENARNTLKTWKKTTIYERGEYLHKVASLFEENVEELANLLVLEVGKDLKSAKSEVIRTAEILRQTVETAKNVYHQSIPADTVAGVKKGKTAITSREPVGVVLAISPFNYPVNLSVSKLAPALMGGNTVVFKPATQGSLCGTYVANLFTQAGLPNGVIELITGKGSEIGDYVVTHKGINFINFTGSTQVGQHIAKEAGMIPLLMELGGKDAAIVLEDADLDLAAGQIVSGAFSYSGQRCTAIKRVLVVNSVADALRDKIVEKMSSLKVGNPLDGNNYDVVPVIDEKSADYIWRLIEDAKNKGATLVTGGTKEGTLFTPTLFDNVTVDMNLAWEEPFGPVLPIIRVDGKDEAVKLANQSEFGLQSSVFTTNFNSAFEVANELEVGTVQINNRTERGPDHLPFLGVKNSGIGVQGVSYSIEAMTTIKSTVINL